MENFFKSSLQVLKEAAESKDMAEIGRIPEEDEDKKEEENVSSLQSSSLSVDNNDCDDSQSLKELFSGKCLCNITVEILDPGDKCVQLEKQIAAVKRAIIHPLERELASLRKQEVSLPTDPELEVVLQKPNGDEEHSQELLSGELSSPKSMSSQSLYDFSPSPTKYNSEIDESKPRPHTVLVDQSLHYQIEGEMLAMRESLEHKQEWRPYYAYHLERFRQMHGHVVRMYQEKVDELEEKRIKLDKSLRLAKTDCVTNRPILTELSKKVVEAEASKKRLQSELEETKKQNDKREAKLRKRTDSVKSKLEEELKVAFEEIEEMEGQLKKFESVKKECRSAKRLNNVLNEKLRQKTKESTDLFAESMRLREQCFNLRVELKEVAETSKTRDENLAAYRLQNIAMKNNLEKLHAMAFACRAHDALDASLRAEIQEAKALVEILEDETRALREEAEYWRKEVEDLQRVLNSQKDFFSLSEECFHSQIVVSEEQTEIIADELLEAHNESTLLRKELADLHVEIQSRLGCKDEIIDSLAHRLCEANNMINSQRKELEVSNNETRLQIEISADLEAKIASERRAAAAADALSQQLNEIVGSKDSAIAELEHQLQEVRGLLQMKTTDLELARKETLEKADEVVKMQVQMELDQKEATWCIQEVSQRLDEVVESKAVEVSGREQKIAELNGLVLFKTNELEVSRNETLSKMEKVLELESQIELERKAAVTMEEQLAQDLFNTVARKDQMIDKLEKQICEIQDIIERQAEHIDISRREILSNEHRILEMEAQLTSERKSSAMSNEVLSKRLMETIVINRCQEKEVDELHATNECLSAQLRDREWKLREEVCLREALEAQLQESNDALESQTFNLEKSFEHYTNLATKLEAVRSKLQEEREESAEAIESLKGKVEEFRMENDLLRYEVDQLKSHLIQEMEDNLKLNEDLQLQSDALTHLHSAKKALCDLTSPQFKNGELSGIKKNGGTDEDKELGLGEFDDLSKLLRDDLHQLSESHDLRDGDIVRKRSMDEVSQITMSFVGANPGDYSSLMKLPLFTNYDVSESLKAQFEELDRALRENVQLLDDDNDAAYASEKKVAEDLEIWSPPSIMADGALPIEKETLVSSRGWDTIAPETLIHTDLVKGAVTRPSPLSPVARSGVMLADSLIEAFQGMNFNDEDAVLEQMETLRELLLQDGDEDESDYTNLVSRFQIYSEANDESQEVTAAEFRARVVMDKYVCHSESSQSGVELQYVTEVAVENNGENKDDTHIEMSHNAIAGTEKDEPVIKAFGVGDMTECTYQSCHLHEQIDDHQGGPELRFDEDKENNASSALLILSHREKDNDDATTVPNIDFEARSDEHSRRLLEMALRLESEKTALISPSLGTRRSDPE